MLDLAHLRDEVGELDQLEGCVAPGDYDVLESRALADRRDDVLDVDPAPLDRVGHLVEQQELVALLRDRALDLLPAGAGEIGGPLEVLGQPRPAVAHLLPVDPSERLGRPGLPHLPLAGLDELEHPAAVAARPRAQEHPERRRALALAVPGDDDRQRPVARLATLGVGAATVLAHAALLDGGVCGRRWWRPPAARASSRHSPTRTGPSSVSISSTASAARPNSAAAASAALPLPVSRPSVSTITMLRRVASRARSRAITRPAVHSPDARGVRPPVGSAASVAAARSIGAPGATTTCAAAWRKAIRATRSRRAYASRSSPSSAPLTRAARRRVPIDPLASTTRHSSTASRPARTC